MPHGLKAKMWNKRNIVMSLIKIFKMIHIKKKGKKTLKNKKESRDTNNDSKDASFFSLSLFPLIPSSIYTLVSLLLFFNHCSSSFPSFFFHSSSSLLFILSFLSNSRSSKFHITISQSSTEVHTQLISHIWLFVTLWTVAHQAPLSMWFSKQEYWSVMHFLLQVGVQEFWAPDECSFAIIL